MKIPIELNIPDDRMFLNFGNWKDGNDVICQIVDGKLMLSQYDEDKELPSKEITFIEFCELVKTSLKIQKN